MYEAPVNQRGEIIDSMTSIGKSSSIIARIRIHYDSLPRSEKQLADMILEFPGEIAGYTATELAGLAGVSKAAVTRLIQRLGYANFDEARRSSRNARAWGSPLYQLSHPLEPGVLREALQQHAERDIHNINRTFQTLDPRQVDRVIDRLVNARKLWLFGFRNSHFLAGYTRWQFAQVRNEVHLFPQGGDNLAEQLVDWSEHDMLVAFGFRRRVSQFGRILKAAHAKRIPILYITDPGAGATVNFAKWVMPAEVEGVGAFDSYTAAMALVHFLSVAMLAKSGPAGRTRLKRIEDLHDDLHEFD
ncbi:MAG: MurR/RpiR family transcriptional regulator [Gammaproteobacteria bacterium]|nr:MurR/RpiR family transcriptional regulator [Gammaproteobacteria bacterium]